ncbi:MAG: hypothetical protein U0905_05365 [Pirellulales bacterium]
MKPHRPFQDFQQEKSPANDGCPNTRDQNTSTCDIHSCPNMFVMLSWVTARQSLGSSYSSARQQKRW